MEIDKRLDRKIQARLCWGSCCSRGEQKQTIVSTAFLFLGWEWWWEVEQAVSLYGVRVGSIPGVWPEGWLRWSAHPFGGGVFAEGMYSTLLLFLTPQKEQLGFWSFSILLLVIAPTVHACSYF